MGENSQNFHNKISNLYWLLLTYDVLYTQFSTQGSIVLKRGEKMLDNRKKKILQAIVEEYIETAEPVSSKSIVEKHGIDYSSATIRNDMAELEKIGLLDKPHTSAGRIPSAQGYRYYVDELLNYNDISMQEIKYIQTQLATKVNQIEDLTKIATSTLSEITHYTSVGIGPRVASQNIEEVKFVLLGSRLLMAIILTESGLIKETIINSNEIIVNMGYPLLKPENIPVNLEGDMIINKKISLGGKEIHINCVSMGNPHVVLFLDEVDNINMEKIATNFKFSDLFPEGCNIEFVKIIDSKSIKMRVYERGCGETFSCGTGACASVVAGILNNLLDSDTEIKVMLKGGTLYVKYNDVVYLKGSIDFICKGKYLVKKH